MKRALLLLSTLAALSCSAAPSKLASKSKALAKAGPVQSLLVGCVSPFPLPGTAEQVWTLAERYRVVGYPPWACCAYSQYLDMSPAGPHATAASGWLVTLAPSCPPPDES